MLKTFKRTSISVVVCAILAATPLALAAETDFPTKPITILEPWKAGSTPDVAMRAVAEIASRSLGQPVVVQNVVGGSGTRATLSLVNADPDGYTLLNNWVAPQVVSRLFNPEVGYSNDDFVPVSGIMSLPFTLLVNESHSANNIAEFVAWANEQGRPINVGVCAALSVPRMVMEELLTKSGVDQYTAVPYNGCMPENITGLLDGSLDATTGVLAAEKVFAGKVKSLAVITDERISLRPDLPTAAEQGVDIGWGDASAGWAGIVAPKGLPADVAAKLGEAFQTAWQSDEFRDLMAENLIVVKYMSNEDFQALWASSEEALRPAVERLLDKQ
jgi:tripartite-type tricarboxylate transporter receptor subunit TctC|tara:strand:- start:4809 stop:5798 length:990 start_codon:yes stop_codon:yes gene_type:complete